MKAEDIKRFVKSETIKKYIEHNPVPIIDQICIVYFSGMDVNAKINAYTTLADEAGGYDKLGLIVGSGVLDYIKYYIESSTKAIELLKSNNENFIYTVYASPTLHANIQDKILSKHVKTYEEAVQLLNSKYYNDYTRKFVTLTAFDKDICVHAEFDYDDNISSISYGTHSSVYNVGRISNHEHAIHTAKTTIRPFKPGDVVTLSSRFGRKEYFVFKDYKNMYGPFKGIFDYAVYSDDTDDGMIIDCAIRDFINMELADEKKAAEYTAGIKFIGDIRTGKFFTD